MKKILAIGNIKNEDTMMGLQLKKIFKEQLEAHEIQIINSGNAIIFKEGMEDNIKDILNENNFSYEDTTDILAYLSEEVRENDDTINILGEEVSWEECCFNEKVEDEEINLNELFEVDVKDADDCLYNLMNQATTDVIQERINKLEDMLEEIKNNTFEEW